MSTVKRRKPASPPIEDSFSRAAWYRDLRTTPPMAVREVARAGTRGPFSERHLQGVWFDPQYRPTRLLGADGEVITVHQPGRWNLGAGPDFLDAHLEVGPDRRTLRGDVEVHLRPDDWTHHGHRDDPLYRAVIAHVTYWPGRLPATALPPGALQIVLKPTLDADPAFYFENIDLTAYPYAVPPAADRGASLAGLDPALTGRLLDAAGEERLRLKTEAMRARMERSSPRQALYETFLAALGYQHNRGPCLRLAHLLPLDRLLDAAGGDAVQAYALLLGTADLLPATPRSDWDEETRRWVRRLWDAWWKSQMHAEGPRLSHDAWRLAGIRPPNHPARRLAGAAAILTSDAACGAALLSLDPAAPRAWLDGVKAWFDGAERMPYWPHRQSLGGTPSGQPIALIGPGRRAAIITNVLIPHAAAHGQDVSPLLGVMPSEDTNQLLRETAHQLFGPDHNPALYATALRRQGLMQIFYDYCLPNRLGDLAALLC